MTRGSVCVAALLALAARAVAQADTTVRRDTTARSDSAARRDTTARDTAPAYLPVFARTSPEGPLPRGARYSFTADSFALSGLQTLSDLLARIPGVYVARGGIYGQAEIALYGGRGPGALEVYWDGVPYLPLGRDSVYLDPARIPMAPLERVDVIVLPASLRVYLVTARQRSTQASTLIRITTGQVRTAGYRGWFLKRWRSGLGLSLAADYNNNDGIPGSSSTAFNSVDLWLKAEYLRSARLGASYQILSSSWRRSASDAPGLVDRFPFERRDAVLRAFAAARPDGLGPRVELTLATTGTGKDTAVTGRSISQRVLALSSTWDHALAGLTVRAQGTDRPWQLEARAAWRPFPVLTFAADARHAAYSGSRSGDRAHLAAGLGLPLGFSAHGDLAWADDLQAPLDTSDSAQRTTDYSGACAGTEAGARSKWAGRAATPSRRSAARAASSRSRGSPRRRARAISPYTRARSRSPGSSSPAGTSTR